jgi:hypothetical protein
LETIEKEINLKEGAIYQGEDKFSPIPLNVASPPINPLDKKLIKANAYETMHHQANQQIEILKRQADLIMQQVKEIEERVMVSKQIYESNISFEPVIGNIYYLYKKSEKLMLSMVAPNEWGKKLPYDEYLNKVCLLADKTWQVLK